MTFDSPRHQRVHEALSTDYFGAPAYQIAKAAKTSPDAAKAILAEWVKTGKVEVKGAPGGKMQADRYRLRTPKEREQWEADRATERRAVAALGKHGIPIASNDWENRVSVHAPYGVGEKRLNISLSGKRAERLVALLESLEGQQ